MEQTTATPADAPPKAQPRGNCPHCGAPAEEDQLVCLSCGGRIALDYRRPPGWKLPTAIVAAVAILAAVAFGFMLRAVTDDAESEVANVPAKPSGGATPASSDAERRSERQAEQRRQVEGDRDDRAERRRGDRANRRDRARSPGAAVNTPGTWPTGRNGYTVILATVADEAAAKASARTVRQAGLPGGYLRSKDYSSLREEAGWYVYGGVYRTRKRAEAAAAKFGRGYPGAYVQLVNGEDAGKPRRRRKRD